MTIYIDEDYVCHATNTGGLREFDVPFFDNKCAEFIDNYRYIPADETWTRKDGEKFKGKAIMPYVDPRIPETAQTSYDSRDDEVAKLMDEITDLCEEIIGE